ncbi:phosphate uptake regulator PhoU [Candidatus Woesearchaeota archaeon]|nr:phosphate uptake regulator PhoU [Candidatus Woesearchaeota archaeon]
MRRKVVLHGPSTLTVSLPSKWARKFDVKRGDELDVEEEENNLKIHSPNSIKRVKQIQFDASQLDETLAWNVLTLLHKSGYDEIKLTSEDTDLFRNLQEKINSTLLGYEVIEQQTNSFLIKNIANEEISEFENILRRTFLVLLNFAKSSHEFLILDHKSLTKLLTLESTIDKLTNFCERVLNKGNYRVDYLSYLYLVVWHLESIGDHYRDICKILSKYPKIHVRKEVLAYYERVTGILERYYHLFYKFDFSAAQKLRMEQSQLKEEMVKLFAENLRQEEILLCHQLLNVNQRVHDLFGATLGLNLGHVTGK